MPYLQDAAITSSITLDTRMLAEVELTTAIAAVREIGIPPIWHITKGGSIQAGAVVRGDAVYFGAMDGILYALGLDGREQWRFKTDGMFFGLPALVDGTIVAGNMDRTVYAIGLDGREQWRFVANDSVAAEVAVGDGLFFGCKDGAFYALERNGRLRWRAVTNGPISNRALVHDGAVIVGSWDKTVSCFDQATGSVRWRFLANGMIITESARIGHIGMFGDSEGVVSALDLATGAVLWTFRSTGNPRSLTACGDLVIVATYGNLLHALDAATGAERWRFLGRNSSTFFTRPGAVHEGVLYFLNTDGVLYALDARTGALLWTFATKAVAVSTPFVAGGRLYFGSYDCNLYCVTLQGALVWAFPTSMSSMSAVNVDSFRREHGREQTFVIAAPVVEVSEERYKERRESESGAPGFSTYVQKSTYVTKSKYA